MEQNIESLICLLKEIRNAYARMTGLSENKKDCIVRGDAQAVGKIAQEEWALFQEIVGLEENRIEVVKGICSEWDIPGGEATLAEIEKRVGDGPRAEIARAGADLKETILMQREINDQNMALLNLHFEYMYFMMETLKGADAGNNIYGHSGVMQEMSAGGASIIDSHV
jgi:flagellar biosynthesis/type III secretory pathway chaperone